MRRNSKTFLIFDKQKNINHLKLKNMKTYKIEISNIDEQPKELIISFDVDDDTHLEWNRRASLGESDDWLVDDVVSDYCYENGISLPTTFDYSFIG